MAHFIAVNPNSKTPMIDDDGVRIFDSNAILLYHAEKTGRFLPSGHRGELLSWMMLNEYLLGSACTITDMSAWGWVRVAPFIFGDTVWTLFSNIKRWFDRINARPAAQRAEALKDQFSFKTDMDEETRRHMFGHLSGK